MPSKGHSQCVFGENLSLLITPIHVIIFTHRFSKSHNSCRVTWLPYPYIHTCVHTYMQTLDGAGCSDNSRALGNTHYLRLYFSHFPPVGQMLQYVSSFCDVPHWPGTQGGGREGEMSASLVCLTLCDSWIILQILKKECIFAHFGRRLKAFSIYTFHQP